MLCIQLTSGLVMTVLSKTCCVISCWFCKNEYFWAPGSKLLGKGCLLEPVKTGYRNSGLISFAVLYACVVLDCWETCSIFRVLNVLAWSCLW